MRRTPLALSAAMLAAAVAAQPATALPPLVVTGAGQLSWGLYVTPPSTPPYPAQALTFTGTATDTATLASYTCAFSGSGATPAPNVVVGTMGGACGPHSYPSCTFALTTSSWTFACGAAVGQFAVQPANVNPTTHFSAIGTIN